MVETHFKGRPAKTGHFYSTAIYQSINHFTSIGRDFSPFFLLLARLSPACEMGIGFGSIKYFHLFGALMPGIKGGGTDRHLQGFVDIENIPTRMSFQELEMSFDGVDFGGNEIIFLNENYRSI